MRLLPIIPDSATPASASIRLGQQRPFTSGDDGHDGVIVETEATAGCLGIGGQRRRS